MGWYIACAASSSVISRVLQDTEVSASVVLDTLESCSHTDRINPLSLLPSSPKGWKKENSFNNVAKLVCSFEDHCMSLAFPFNIVLV